MPKVPRVMERLRGFLVRHPELTADLPDPLAQNPNGSTLQAVVNEKKLRRILEPLLDETGHRPVFGGSTQFQEDPHWRDRVLFYEYFHGDNGAYPQTGWTGVVAKLLGDLAKKSPGH